jgi:hypothetical protein
MEEKEIKKTRYEHVMARILRGAISELQQKDSCNIHYAALKTLQKACNMKKRKTRETRPGHAIAGVLRDAISELEQGGSYGMCYAIFKALQKAYCTTDREIDLDGMVKSRFDNQEMKDRFKKFVEEHYPDMTSMVTIENTYWLNHYSLDKGNPYSEVRMAFLQSLIDKIS